MLGLLSLQAEKAGNWGREECGCYVKIWNFWEWEVSKTTGVFKHLSTYAGNAGEVLRELTQRYGKNHPLFINCGRFCSKDKFGCFSGTRGCAEEPPSSSLLWHMAGIWEHLPDNSYYHTARRECGNCKAFRRDKQEWSETWATEDMRRQKEWSFFCLGNRKFTGDDHRKIRLRRIFGGHPIHSSPLKQSQQYLNHCW